jgi:hypothetical protein
VDYTGGTELPTRLVLTDAAGLPTARGRIREPLGDYSGPKRLPSVGSALCRSA